jgi:hypothetical protein
MLSPFRSVRALRVTAAYAVGILVTTFQPEFAPHVNGREVSPFVPHNTGSHWLTAQGYPDFHVA